MPTRVLAHAHTHTPTPTPTPTPTLNASRRWPSYTGAGWDCPTCGGGLAKNMTGVCDVLHAPFSGDGGACDTRYGLQCADMWLGSTLGGASAPQYRVITFNFGLHDTNDSGEDEEARDEFVPLDEYGANLLKFVAKVRGLQPQARLAWLSSTPMHFDMHLNGNVNAYNALAHTLLVAPKDSATPPVVDAFLDLNKVIIDVCGQPPYYGSKLAPAAKNHCPLISDNEEYHYNQPGWKLLAAHVAAEIKALLHKGARREPPAARGAAAGPKMCPDGLTSCGAGMSCVADQYSSTKWGCCMTAAGVGCGDGFHCCPAGHVCMANGTNPVSPAKPKPLSFSHVCVQA